MSQESTQETFSAPTALSSPKGKRQRRDKDSSPSRASPGLDSSPPALTHRSSSGKLYKLMKPTLSEAFEQARRLDERRKSFGEIAPAAPGMSRHLLKASISLNVVLLCILFAIHFTYLTQYTLDFGTLGRWPFDVPSSGADSIHCASKQQFDRYNSSQLHGLTLKGSI